MVPITDTYAAALKVERTLALQRAEHRAQLLAVAGWSRSTPHPVPVATTSARRAHLPRVLGFLRRLRRPVHAQPGSFLEDRPRETSAS
jgi:hypothetical protein